MGVGPDNERNTGPSSGEGDGLAAASGEGSGLAADSGARTEFSTPGVPSAAGEAAGRMTTRGVAEAPGEGAFSAGDGEGSIEGLVFSIVFGSPSAVMNGRGGARLASEESLQTMIDVVPGVIGLGGNSDHQRRKPASTPGECAANTVDQNSW